MIIGAHYINSSNHPRGITMAKLLETFTATNDDGDRTIINVLKFYDGTISADSDELGCGHSFKTDTDRGNAEPITPALVAGELARRHGYRLDETLHNTGRDMTMDGTPYTEAQQALSDACEVANDLHAAGLITLEEHASKVLAALATFRQSDETVNAINEKV